MPLMKQALTPKPPRLDFGAPFNNILVDYQNFGVPEALVGNHSSRSRQYGAVHKFYNKILEHF